VLTSIATSSLQAAHKYLQKEEGAELTLFDTEEVNTEGIAIARELFGFFFPS